VNFKIDLEIQPQDVTKDNVIKLSEYIDRFRKIECLIWSTKDRPVKLQLLGTILGRNLEELDIEDDNAEESLDLRKCCGLKKLKLKLASMGPVMTELLLRDTETINDCCSCRYPNLEASDILMSFRHDVERDDKQSWPGLEDMVQALIPTCPRHHMNEIRLKGMIRGSLAVDVPVDKIYLQITPELGLGSFNLSIGNKVKSLQMIDSHVVKVNTYNAGVIEDLVIEESIPMFTRDNLFHLRTLKIKTIRIETIEEKHHLQSVLAIATNLRSLLLAHIYIARGSHGCMGILLPKVQTLSIFDIDCVARDIAFSSKLILCVPCWPLNTYYLKPSYPRNTSLIF